MNYIKYIRRDRTLLNLTSELVRTEMKILAKKFLKASAYSVLPFKRTNNPEGTDICTSTNLFFHILHNLP